MSAASTGSRMLQSRGRNSERYPIGRSQYINLSIPILAFFLRFFRSACTRFLSPLPAACSHNLMDQLLWQVETRNESCHFIPQGIVLKDLELLSTFPLQSDKRSIDDFEPSKNTRLPLEFDQIFYPILLYFYFHISRRVPSSLL